MTIRPLEILELPLCGPLGQRFHEEARLPGRFDLDTFVANWSRYFLHLPARLWGCWQGEELIGGLGAVIAPDDNDGRLTATEYFFYVAPEHRGGTAAGRLLARFEAWADEQGAECRLKHLLAEEESPRESKLAQHYRKRGYRPVEVAWVRPAKRKEG